MEMMSKKREVKNCQNLSEKLVDLYQKELDKTQTLLEDESYWEGFKKRKGKAVVLYQKRFHRGRVNELKGKIKELEK